jgi:hypothetical protein
MNEEIKENTETNAIPTETQTDTTIPTGENKELSNAEVSTDSISTEQKTIQSKESSQSLNFRAIREQKERVERERDEALRKYQELEATQRQQIPVQQQKPIDEDLDIHIGDDELAEGKHLSKLDKKIRKLEQQLAEATQRTTAMTMESKLIAEHSDFYSIVTEENVKTLAAIDPDVAAGLAAIPNEYNKAKTVYKLIKRYGIPEENKPNPDKELAIKNAAKPKPSASVAPQTGDSPLGMANAFSGTMTKELRAKLLAEMNEARRRN